jgi:hypothetical protein
MLFGQGRTLAQLTPLIRSVFGSIVVQILLSRFLSRFPFFKATKETIANIDQNLFFAKFSADYGSR